MAASSDILALLDEKIKDYFFKTLKHKEFTAVQAYILPTMQIIYKKCSQLEENEALSKCQIYALIAVPSRELAAQVSQIMQPICDLLGFNLVRFVGGSDKKKKTESQLQGRCIIIGTPGRLEHLINHFADLKNYFKTLEVLVIDEADQFNNLEYRKKYFLLHRIYVFSITGVLSILPKQRRTGLFSATQAKDMEEILKFGLRNPIRLNVTSDKNLLVDSKENTNNDKNVTPKELSNYYILNDFRKSKQCILMCTDLMARGLDIENIDWVLQFDIPRQSRFVLISINNSFSLFIHRSGRSGRNGQLGRALVFLTHEEQAYINFIEEHEQVQLKEWTIEGMEEEGAADKLRKDIQQLAIQNRLVLENGTRAFVSFIQAYIKHDCQIICNLRSLDLVGIAHSFGLLRIPQMKELNHGKIDFRDFKKRDDIKTSSIPFKNKKLEAKRQEKLKAKVNGTKMEEKIEDSENEDKEERKTKKRTKLTEWEELQQEQRLLKKFKAGKISKKEIDELL